MYSSNQLRLLATGISLQQMHGCAFAQSFLEEHGILKKNEAQKLTCWAAYALPHSEHPEFEHEFRRAIQWLTQVSEFLSSSIGTNDAFHNCLDSRNHGGNESAYAGISVTRTVNPG